ncbi:MAG TPA: MtrB/PioB family outer membrane beta-barrel protein, partial [Micropepsaceae bacterium]|nr:MtrB/PioB family outer membrane beta-barrel protein [Micropepsaceae bacterium]
MEKSRRRVSRLPLRALLLTGATALAFSPAIVRADTAVGADSATGNTFNPSGEILHLQPDPLGLSALFENSRSPTGLLYPRPWLLPEMVQSSSDPDWWSSAWGEAGYLGNAGRMGASGSLQYSDLHTGFLLSSAGFLAENRKTAFYFSGEAENVARDDQSYRATFGKYGVFSTSLFFDSIPHVFSTQAVVLWNGIGTGRLPL